MTSPYLNMPLRTEGQAKADIKARRDALLIASQHPLVSAAADALTKGVGYAMMENSEGGVTVKEIRREDILKG